MVIQEAFVNGVSTRKIESLTRARGHGEHAAAQISESNKDLDVQVADSDPRLAEEYPFLWIDARYQKVRVEERMVSASMMIAYRANKARRWKILAVESMFDECEDSRGDFFRKLKGQGDEKGRFLGLRRPRRPPSRRP